MTRRVKQRILSARFGDGYFQAAADGINSQFEEIDLSWDNLTQSQRDTVVAVLKAAGAVDYLTFTPPGDGSSKKYMVVPQADATLYTETDNDGVTYTVSIQLIQVF